MSPETGRGTSVCSKRIRLPEIQSPPKAAEHSNEPSLIDSQSSPDSAPSCHRPARFPNHLIVNRTQDRFRHNVVLLTVIGSATVQTRKIR